MSQSAQIKCQSKNCVTCNWMTSARDDFLLETYCTQSSPSSVHSLFWRVILPLTGVCCKGCTGPAYLGGNIECKMSSVGVLVCCSSNLSVFAPPFAAIEVDTSVGSSYRTSDEIGGIITAPAPEQLAAERDYQV